MAIKPTTSAAPRNRLAGMIAGGEVPLRESLLARGWKHLSADEREMALTSWIGAWRVAWERREPQPSAVTVFDARQSITLEIPGRGTVERIVGPTRYQGSATHAERSARLETKDACLRAADSARQLSFALRVVAAGKVVDRRIVYTPKSPDHSEDERTVTSLRASLTKALGPVRSSGEIWSAMHLLGIADERLKLDEAILSARSPNLCSRFLLGIAPSTEDSWRQLRPGTPRAAAQRE